MAVDETLSSLIGSIYDAAVDEGRWDCVLSDLRDAFAASAVEELEAIVPLGESILRNMPSAWVEQHDVAHGLVIAVLRDRDHSATLEIVREKGKGAFDAGAFELARLLVPHLARSVAIERGMALDRARSAAATATRRGSSASRSVRSDFT